MPHPTQAPDPSLVRAAVADLFRRQQRPLAWKIAQDWANSWTTAGSPLLAHAAREEATRLLNAE
jgi:hypothetical protein